MNHLNINLKDPEPLYRQVASELRNLILSGKLKAGEKLPTIQALAKQCNSNYFTVQTALKILVKEGLIDSLPRIGTFVREPKNKLTSVGIYYCGDFWGSREMGFYRQVHLAIQRRLAKERIQAITWIDERNSKNQGAPLPELKRALLRHEVQAVIVPMCNDVDVQWLQSLSVPVSMLASSGLPCNVNFDSDQFLRLGLESLAGQGCKEIGLISIIQKIRQRSDGSKHSYGEFYTRFEVIAEELGLKFQDQRVQFPRPSQELSGHFEQFGYAAFNKIWNSENRPDGILVYPDVVAWGVIVSVLEKRIKIPDELKLVFHQNAGIDYLCPFPANYIISDPAEAANALFDLVKCQYRGKKILARQISYSATPLQVHIDPSLDI